MQSILERAREGLQRAEGVIDEADGFVNQAQDGLNQLEGITAPPVAALPAEVVPTPEPVPVPESLLDTGDIIVLTVILLVCVGAAAFIYNSTKSIPGVSETRPRVTYRLLRLLSLFVLAAGLAVFAQHLEVVSNSKVPGWGAVVNQAHRWVQFIANTTWASLAWVVVVDILSFRFANIIELVYNKADVGREDVFVPIPDTGIRIALIFFYGLSYATFVYSANVLFGN